jgi:hypothetical protein
MNGATRNFLDEYRNADFTRRLDLYLQYPELRSEFTQIEQIESAHRQPNRKPGWAGMKMACKVRPWNLFRLRPGLDKGC